jgi:hypothetical protein
MNTTTLIVTLVSIIVFLITVIVFLACVVSMQSKELKPLDPPDLWDDAEVVDWDNIDE